MKALMILCAAGMAALSGTISGDDTPKAADAVVVETSSDVTATVVAVSADTGSVTGKVVWEGDRPEPLPALTIKEAETEGCKHGGPGVATDDRSMLIAADGGVANVVMMIEATDIVIPDAPIVLDQVGCRFEPRVVVVPVGASLKFSNSDDTNHNIHTYAKKNKAMNKNVAGDTSIVQELTKAEVINVACDIHNWMKSFVMVTDASHYAVSGADGTFTIAGLPPGEYKISWWHETLGKGKTDKVKVEAGKATDYVHKVGEAKKKKKKGRR